MKNRPNNKKTVSDCALEYHKLGLCVIPIKPNSKVPAVRSWKQYQAKRPDESQLRKWFANNNRNIAVVLGKVSNDLVCRDFDKMAEYEQWADKYDDLAKILPTVRTAKGMHVYFEGHIEGIKHLENGEIRGRGGYCLLPPSVHPEGQIYKWVNPLNNGNLLVVDPELAGFIPDGTEQSEQSEQTKAIYKVKGFVKVNESIQSLIKETIPQKIHTRNRQIWEFVRAIQGIPHLANTDPVKFISVFGVWYKEALPYIETEDFEESWFDFLYAWDNVIFPKGVEMANIFQKAIKAPVPEAVSHYTQPNLHLLASWCRELQFVAKDKPFWLSVRTVAKYLHVSKMTAWRYLFILTREKVLDEVEKGKMTKDGGIATRFRYIAN